MAEEEITDKGANHVVPNFLVIGSFGRKEKDSDHLGHVPDTMLKNSTSEPAAVPLRPLCEAAPRRRPNRPCATARSRLATLGSN